MRLERHPSHDLQTGGALPLAAALCSVQCRIDLMEIARAHISVVPNQVPLSALIVMHRCMAACPLVWVGHLTSHGGILGETGIYCATYDTSPHR